jgi:hypothetical protein
MQRGFGGFKLLAAFSPLSARNIRKTKMKIALTYNVTRITEPLPLQMFSVHHELYNAYNRAV